MEKDENILKECTVLRVRHFTIREGGNGREREMYSDIRACVQRAGGSEIDSLQEKFIYRENISTRIRMRS
jgi:hypothetical protein